ncbi:MAG: hypothetical protein CSA53_04110 [Gammaproteobacteria bacterium]|nr:MAG: hypothetical protein CSA53_04110 [Gammaproteobacteria bacterium]
MKKGGRSRRRYIVNGRYQFGQVMVTILANSLMLILSFCLLIWFYLMILDGSTAYSHNSAVAGYMVVSLVVITAASSYCSFRRSRRIAGMMEKLEKLLDDASRGVFPEQRIVFRRDDYFTRLEGPLNACMEVMQEGSNPDRAALLSGLSALARRLEDENPDRETMKNEINELLHGVNRQDTQ